MREADVAVAALPPKFQEIKKWFIM